MLKVIVDYPEKAEELEIMQKMGTTGEIPEVKSVVSAKEILAARKVLDEVYMDEKVERYIVELIFATRDPESVGLNELKGLISFGASPRASIFLRLASKAHAFIMRRGYVTPEDIRAIGMDVMRHRIILTYEAEAEEMTTETIIERIFDTVEVP